jgi:hypothetical protein
MRFPLWLVSFFWRLKFNYQNVFTVLNTLLVTNFIKHCELFIFQKSGKVFTAAIDSTGGRFIEGTSNQYVCEVGVLPMLTSGLASCLEENFGEFLPLYFPWINQEKKLLNCLKLEIWLTFTIISSYYEKPIYSLSSLWSKVGLNYDIVIFENYQSERLIYRIYWHGTSW